MKGRESSKERKADREREKDWGGGGGGEEMGSLKRQTDK